MKQLSLKIVQKYKRLIYLTWGEDTPKYFFFLFFLRGEGENGCIIHFFTSHQPPSALNKSTSGWPVEARKMAATKFFCSVGEVKTKAIIVSWRTSARSFFCDGEISAGVPTHIITCNCNNRLVYIHILLHPSFFACKPLLSFSTFLTIE